MARRVVVVSEEYRVIRHGQPSPRPPPENGGSGGGWFATAVGFGLCILIVLGIEKLTDDHPSPQPAAPVVKPSPVVKQSPPTKDTARRVIASATIEDNECRISGSVNGAPSRFIVDSGAGEVALFSVSHLGALGINRASLHFEEVWPGTRYGKIAKTTVREIRVGDVVWLNEPVEIYANWRFAFGDDETPLLGLGALQEQGVNLEFEGNICRLTVANSSQPSQCSDYRLSKTRSDQALQLCQAQCSAAPWCRRL
jgi:predicted aspartyl protease